jgi:hypothetical protein
VGDFSAPAYPGPDFLQDFVRPSTSRRRYPLSCATLQAVRHVPPHRRKRKYTPNEILDKEIVLVKATGGDAGQYSDEVSSV